MLCFFGQYLLTGGWCRRVALQPWPAELSTVFLELRGPELTIWQRDPQAGAQVCAMLCATARSTLGQAQRLALGARHHQRTSWPSCIDHVRQWCQRCSLLAPELY